MEEKITDYDSKTMEELSVPILTKEEFEQKQIEAMQEEISTKAQELWNDALNNIDNLVYPHKWDYLDYLEGLRCRKTSTLTLQQVKVKADLFQFSGDDLNVDMKLHSLVLKKLNVKMYSSELYDDYIKVVDVMEKKQSDETRNNDYYSDEK